MQFQRIKPSDKGFLIHWTSFDDDNSLHDSTDRMFYMYKQTEYDRYWTPKSEPRFTIGRN